LLGKPHASEAPEPLSPLHAAHNPAGTLHTGVVATHEPWFVAEHWPQAPDGSHAGLLLVGQAWAVPDPKSPLQPVHKPEPTLHNGVFPLQSALPMHGPQRCGRIVVSQCGAAAVQSASVTH